MHRLNRRRVHAPACPLDEVDDPPGPIAVIELGIDEMGVAVGDDRVIGRHDIVLLRIIQVGELVKGDVALPLIGVVPPRCRKTTGAHAANRNASGCLVPDVSVDVGVHEVLRGDVEERDRVTELFEVSGAIEAIDRFERSIRLEGGPAQAELGECKAL